MKLSTAFIALAATVLPAIAVPTAEPAELVERDPAALDLEKRDNTIYVCEGTDWNGRCVTYSPPYNTCQPWSALGLSGLGSWGPAEGVYCIWYNGPCGASGVTGSDSFTYPGWAPVPGYWQYNTQSWKCWW